MKIFQTLSYLLKYRRDRRLFSTNLQSNQCKNYNPYIPMVLTGGFFFLLVRRDHNDMMVHTEVFRREMKDFIAKQQNDNARMITVLESTKK